MLIVAHRLSSGLQKAASQAVLSMLLTLGVVHEVCVCSVQEFMDHYTIKWMTHILVAVPNVQHPFGQRDFACVTHVAPCMWVWENMGV